MNNKPTIRQRFLLVTISLMILTTLSCNNFNSFENAKLYFANHKNTFNQLINLTLNKKGISLILRRSFNNIFYKVFKQQEINYKIENYSNGLQIEFAVNNNFENEQAEIKKILYEDKVRSRIRDSNISLDSALSQIDLNRDDILVIFQQMGDLKVSYVSRFKEDLNSIYFSIEDKFFIIFSNNIKNINLERNVLVHKLEDNWYYYNGKL